MPPVHAGSLMFASGLSDHLDAVTAAERACDHALAAFQASAGDHASGAPTERPGATPFAAPMPAPGPASAPTHGPAVPGEAAIIGPGFEATLGARSAMGGATSGDPDLVLAFVSHHHADLMGAVGDVLHRRLSPGALVAVSAEAVLGLEPGVGPVELEGKPGISVFAARLPGVTVRTFTSEDLPFLDETDAQIGDKLARAIGAGEDVRAILLFADPFSVPMVKLMPALSRMCRLTLGLKRSPVLGGMASAGDKPGSNGLVINKRLSRTGAVGVVLSGAVAVDPLLSQGCKAFGPTYVVTGGKHNVLLALSGRPALQALHEAIETIPPEDRQQLEKGVFLGRVVNEYKDRFGRGDYLIRNVLGVDQSRGALAVADMLRVGQTVRFHLRDAKTADEDLRLALTAQRLRSPALGALLFTCNGRGTRLFEQKSHDATLLGEALTPEGGAEAAPPPIAGFFAAGEIGPVGDEAFLHGQSACAAVFRERFGADDE